MQSFVKLLCTVHACHLPSLHDDIAAATAVSAGAAASGDGEDVSSLLTASWRAMRRSVLKRNGVPEFAFRQYLFAAQVSLTATSCLYMTSYTDNNVDTTTTFHVFVAHIP